jgi:signal transduction histidine kinase
MNVRAVSRRYGDLLLAVVLGATMTAELLAWADRRVGIGLALGLLATMPLALRRRSPLISYLLVMVALNLLVVVQRGFDNDSFTFVLVFFIALYSLGRHAAGLEGWLGAVALVATMVSFVHSEGGLAQADLGDFAFVLMFVGAPWAAGRTIRLRRERESVLNAENERLQRDQQEQSARAVAEERSRIARELHDVVSHAISVTVLQARGARRTLHTDPVAARKALDAIEQTNTAALGDMRRLLAVLRDTEPESLVTEDHAPQPSLAHLERLITHVRDSGVPVEVDVVGTPQDLPPGVDLSAYRIVQEALTNVLKHTAQARVRVLLAYADDALSVTVTDDGIPGPLNGTEPGGGHGLIGIRERVAVVGGDVEAGPRPAGGYEVRARLPFALEVS